MTTRKQKGIANPGTSIVVHQPQAPQALRNLPEKMAELQARKHLIEMVEAIYATLMVEGIDYGIPLDSHGKPIFDKPMLYRAGAELLRLYLELQFKPHVEDKSVFDLPIPRIRYSVITDFYDKLGNFLGSGLGVCSSLETKYRYRWFFANQLPTSMKAGMIKTIKDVNGKEKGIIDQQVWIDTYGVGSVRFTQYGIQVRLENPDIADLENVIAVQAKKRSFVDGIKSVTGAGRIFLIGQADIRAATSKHDEGGEIINGEEVDIEATEEQAEQSTKAQEIRTYQETLKNMMIKAGWTLPDGKLDIFRFKKLLQETYKVENISQLDDKGRDRLLSQMADIAAAREEC